MADDPGTVRGDAGAVLAASLEKALGALVGTAEVTFQEVRALETLRPLPGPLLALTFGVTKGAGGTGALLLPGAAALRLARLLLGEETAGIPEGPGAAESEVFAELAAQVAGAAATGLGSLAGTPVGFEAPAAQWLAGGGQAFAPPAATVCLALDLTAGPVRAEAHLVLPWAGLAPPPPSSPAAGPGASASPLPPLPTPPAPRRGSGLEMLLDISLPVAVELGRTRMMIRDILHLAPGSVLELDKLAGDPVEIMINGKSIARGEVVVIDDNFGVRLTTIVTPSERVMHLK